LFESAYLKVERATEHIAQLSKTIREEKPFTYILKTDSNTKERITLPKKNEAVVAKCAIITGDAIHNMRAALDHAYYEVVSPFCTTPGHIKACQFPFCELEAKLHGTIQNRLAHLAGPWLVASLTALKPYSEAGGNELLCLIHDLDIMDKHQLMIPAGDYTKISTATLRAQVLDLPGFIGGNMSFGGNKLGDICWPLSQNVYNAVRGAIPPNGILEQELQVPVEIIFKIGTPGPKREFVATLNAMLDATKVAIEAMRKP